VKKTILLVEDEAIIALDEKCILEDLGYNVIMANSGEEAVKTFFSTEDINLILMDINLGPGMDGPQAAEKILSSRDIPVIFLSSHTEFEIVKKTEGITSYGYIVKGCNDAVLHASISMAFRLYNEKLKRKESEKNLGKEKIRFQNMANSVPGVLCSILINSYNYKKIYYSSPQIKDLLGFTFEELSLAPSLFFDRIDSGYMKKIDEFINISIKEQRPLKFSSLYSHPRKGDIYLKCSLSPVKHSDNETMFHGFITDITESWKSRIELERSEESYRNLINGMNETVWILEFNGKIIEVNDSVERTLGYKRNEVIGKEISFIDPDIPKEKRIGLMDRLKKDSKAMNIFETYHTTKSGNKIPVEICSTITNYNGKKSTLNIVRDISKRKEFEKALKSQIEEKETLLKIAHHRIKNNIAAIGSLISLQANTLEDETSKSVLQDTLGRVNCMHILYDSLLKTDHYKDLETENYIKQIIGSILSIFTDKNEIEIDIDCDNFTLSERGIFPLGVIVEELMTNIMKYAFPHSNSGRVEVTLKKEKEQACLQIKDNGCGLPEGFSNQDLSGFGLTIVDIMSKQLRGTFSIKECNGTLCTLNFPIKE